MCTLTVIPLRDAAPDSGFALRIVTNRDESRSRPPALPPSVRRIGALRAAWPVDPQGGGTWIAANDRGLVLALMNLNPSPAPPAPSRDRLLSRGLVIPALIDAVDAQAASRRLSTDDLSPFAPFRLVGVDTESIVECRWDRARLAVARLPMAPACFVSSGLGDERVAPRLNLFRDWFAGAVPTAAAQDSFHRHSWPDHPEISVRMSRSDARTVSTTAVEVSHVSDPPTISMTYADDTGQVCTQLSAAGAMLASAGGEPSRC